jgi:hypothetical protein
LFDDDAFPGNDAFQLLAARSCGVVGHENDIGGMLLPAGRLLLLFDDVGGTKPL